MKRVHAFLLVLCLALWGAHAPADVPDPDGEETLARVFAHCAGRFSAELEHHWLMGRSQGQDFEQHRQYAIDLLDATVSTKGRSRVLAWRINAKHAHARLLQTADLSPIASKAIHARRLAQARLAECRAMMLGAA